MSETGVIHDIGYQRYEGVRLGRRAALTALYVHGCAPRSGSAVRQVEDLPVAGRRHHVLVAVIVAAVRSQTGIVLLNYIQFDDAMSWLVIFFVGDRAPELVSRDMRLGRAAALLQPAAAGRRLRRRQGRGAGHGGVAAARRTAARHVPRRGVHHQDRHARGVERARRPAAGWGYSLLWALLFTAISLLIASLTGKRAFAAAARRRVPDDHPDRRRAVDPALQDGTGSSPAGQPGDPVSGVGPWLIPATTPGLDIGRFGLVYAIEAGTLIAACLLLATARYRKVASL
jgi:ABC-2 type transport system permease protein